MEKLKTLVESVSRGRGKKGVVTDYAILQGAKTNRDGVVGIAPVIDPVDYPDFAAEDGYLSYRKVFVRLPQKRVRPKLSQRLTDLVFRRRKEWAEHGFGRFEDYHMSQYGHELANTISPEFYYYQGKPYCCIMNPTKVQDSVQWFHLDFVRAYADEKGYLHCRDVLIADTTYDEKKFTEDLISSNRLYEIPLFIKPNGREC